MRGYLSDVRPETNRAPRRGKSAVKKGYDSIVDRYIHDSDYADQIEKHDLPYYTLAEWEGLCESRKREPLPACIIPHEVWEMQYAR